ncbi:MAG: 4a-hydroxytetrahydrobiopterin dehydratase [Vulcanisaeta sp.]|jgi:4a-hydroxytetrahydrobiopterin dehydratase
MGQQSMVRLSREDIEKSLPTGWRVEGNYLVRDLEFKTFMDCIAFINELARLAESEEHHPDMLIVWKHLTLRLTTHDEGGITELDIKMANLINGLIEKWKDRLA